MQIVLAPPGRGTGVQQPGQSVGSLSVAVTAAVCVTRMCAMRVHPRVHGVGSLLGVGLRMVGRVGARGAASVVWTCAVVCPP
jgi:hypothetical protein